MATDAKIAPALTAEEWRTFLRYPAETEDLVAKLRDEVDAGTPHGAAALCLHGQPFGFTRRDVENLRTTPIGGNTLPSEVDEYRAALNNLAARIEALLPPEE